MWTWLRYSISVNLSFLMCKIQLIIRKLIHIWILSTMIGTQSGLSKRQPHHLACAKGSLLSCISPGKISCRGIAVLKEGYQIFHYLRFIFFFILTCTYLNKTVKPLFAQFLLEPRVWRCGCECGNSFKWTKSSCAGLEGSPQSKEASHLRKFNHVWEKNLN